MSHQRQLIRTELKRRIIAAATAASTRVYSNRSQPLFDETFPVVLIYAKSDRAEKKDENPIRLERTIDIAIEIIAEGNSDPENALDDICLQVEEVIGGAMQDYLKSNGTGDKLVSGIMIGDTELKMLRDGESYYASAAIAVECVYNDFLPRDVTGTMDDLETIGVDYNIDNSQAPLDQAHDLLTDLDV